METKILVTGGTGFVGEHLVRDMAKKYKISCLVREKTYKKCPGVRYLKGNLLDYESLLEATKNIDLVIHLASLINSRKKESYKEVNVLGTADLLKACKENKVKRIIYIGSINATLKNRGPYAQSKKEAEELVINSGLDYIVIRPTMVYDDEGRNDIKRIVSFVRKHKIISIIGNGRHQIQPIHVLDLVKVIVKCVDPKTKNKVFNIGGPDKISFNELIDLISSKKKRKIHVPKILVKIGAKILNMRFNFDLETMDQNKIVGRNDAVVVFKIKLHSFRDDLKKICR